LALPGAETFGPARVGGNEYYVRVAYGFLRGFGRKLGSAFGPVAASSAGWAEILQKIRQPVAPALAAR